MNSSFFRTTFIFIFVFIFFIILCFFSLINNLSINNSSIISDNNIFDFSSSRFFMAYSAVLQLLLHHLDIEVLLLQVHLPITLVLILALLLGTNILAIFSGTVTYTGFSGAGGFTVTIKSENITASYCHVSPAFLVSVGEYVLKGTVIANVGPKNVYGVSNNPYKDSLR